MDNLDLQMALQGYQSQAQTIAQRIGELRQKLGLGNARPGKTSPHYEARRELVVEVNKPPVKRALSAKARRTIAAAQKKRWAKFRAEQRTAAKKQPQRVATAGA